MTTIKTDVSLPETLFHQAEAVAQHLNVSHSQLVTLALEQFIAGYDKPIRPDENPEAASRLIHQGDVYWVPLTSPVGVEPGVTHPHVVLQVDVLNHSRITTVVVCALTSNLKKVNIPGNILLEVGEAQLTRQSVVEVSKVSSVDKLRLGAYIGSLSEARVQQILAGMRFLQRSSR